MDKLLKSMDLDPKEYNLLYDTLLHIDNNANYDSFIKNFSEIEEKTIENAMKKLAKIIDKYNFNGILKILEKKFIHTDSYSEKQKSMKGGLGDDDPTRRPTPGPGQPTHWPTRRPTLSAREIRRDRDIIIFIITFSTVIGCCIVLYLIFKLILILRSRGIIGRNVRRSRTSIIRRTVRRTRNSIGRTVTRSRINLERSYQRIIAFYRRFRSNLTVNQLPQYNNDNNTPSVSPPTTPPTSVNHELRIAQYFNNIREPVNIHDILHSDTVPASENTIDVLKYAFENNVITIPDNVSDISTLSEYSNFGGIYRKTRKTNKN